MSLRDVVNCVINIIQFGHFQSAIIELSLKKTQKNEIWKC